jgi:hypothetical protein
VFDYADEDLKKYMTNQNGSISVKVVKVIPEPVNPKIELHIPNGQGHSLLSQ